MSVQVRANTNLPLPTIVETVFAKKTAVFCGAGVSINSGLPSANALVWEILKKLDLPDILCEKIIASSLPFEYFMQILSEKVSIDPILNIFEIGEPNLNHTTIAVLCKLGILNTVFTTNFDLLYEKSFLSIGMQPGEDYDVYSNDTEFEFINWQCTRKIKLIKLHGSINDRHELSIHLRQVSRNKHSGPMRDIISQLFDKEHFETVLFMGYSFSDVFDISPHISAIGPTETNVFVIEHYPAIQDQLSYNNGDIVDISNTTSGSPFKEFSNAQKIYISTDEFIAHVRKIYQTASVPTIVNTTEIGTLPDWKRSINLWVELESDTLRPGVRAGISADILYAISEYKNALKLRMLELDAIPSIDLHSLANCFEDISVIYESMGQYEKSLEYVEMAAHAAQSLGDDAAIIGSSLAKARVLTRLADYKTALDLAKESLTHYKETGITERIGAVYGLMATCFLGLSKFKNARNCFKKVLSISIEIGDKENEGIAWSGLSNIDLIFNNFDGAKHNGLMALKVAKELGDVSREGRLAGNLGSICFEQDKMKDALSWQECALDIAVQTEDRGSEAIVFCNIANIYFEMENLELAMDNYEKSGELAMALGDNETIAMSMSAMGQIELIKGRFDAAEKFTLKAIEICKASGDKSLEGACCRDMAIIYKTSENFAQSHSFLNQSITLLVECLGEDHPEVVAARELMENGSEEAGP